MSKKNTTEQITNTQTATAEVATTGKKVGGITRVKKQQTTAETESSPVGVRKQTTAEVTAETAQQTEEQKKAIALQTAKDEMKKNYRYDTDNSRALFVRVTGKEDSTGWGTVDNLTVRTFPKTAIEGQEQAFFEVVQKLIICNDKEPLNSTLATIDTKIDKAKTASTVSKLKQTKERTKALLNRDNKVMELLEIEKAEFDDLGYLIACDITNTPPNIETGSLRTHLITISGKFDKEVLNMMDGNTALLTEEVKECLQETKDIIKDIFSKFAKATKYNKEFKVSIGNKDILDLYKAGYNLFTDSNRYGNSKDKSLEKYLCKMYLRKVKVLELETPTAK